MAYRLAALRRLPISRQSRVTPALLRSYATPTQPPKPPRNKPPPKGLEGLFGNPKPASGTPVAPKPAGVEPPAGPSLPKRPETELPGGFEEGKEEPSTEEDAETKRAKLSDKLGGNAGRKVGTGGGGGGGSGPGGEGPNGFGGMSGNQLLLALISCVLTSGPFADR